MSFECPDGYMECTIPCPKCKSTWYSYCPNGPHMEVKCVHCGSHITYVSKVDSKKQFAKWKKAVKERDNYICQRCGEPLQGKRAEAHHKLPVWWTRNTLLKDMEYDLDNGITLCLKCHRQLHGVNGIIKDEEETED